MRSRSRHGDLSHQPKREPLQLDTRSLDMPMTKKGKTIKSAMMKKYGKKKGESVYHASRQKGTIKGVEKKGY